MKKSRFVLWFRSHTMKMQLAISFTLLFCIAMVIATFVYTDLLINDAKMQSSIVFKQTANICGMQFNNLMTHVNAVSKAPLYSSEIQESMINGTPFTESSRMRMLQSIAETSPNDGRYDVVLYDMNGNLLYSYIIISPSTSYITRVKAGALNREAEKHHGKVFFMKAEDAAERYSFMAVRQIHSTSVYRPIGYIAIIVKRDAFDSLLGDDIRGTLSGLLLMNGENEVLYSSFPGGALPEELTGLTERDYTFLDTENYFASSLTGDMDAYRIILYSEKGMLLGEIYRTRSLLLTICAAMILLTAVIIYMLSSNITKPLMTISSLMERVQDGDTSVRFHALYDDEVGKLGKNFNIMLEKLEQEMQHVATVEAEKRQAQIDILKSQINPHFIYNTMETFRMMALECGEYELSELIACFGKMLRYNVSHISEPTTAEEEIRYLTYYLRIQNIRYNGRIKLETDIEEGMQKQKLLRLLIQPVVENSILHGMCSSGSEAIHIHIRIRRSGEFCLIDIEDDGVGTTEEQLLRLKENISRNYIEASGSSSIGLWNIRERIRLHYGETYGMEPECGKHGGMVIHITLPFEQN